MDPGQGLPSDCPQKSFPSEEFLQVRPLPSHFWAPILVSGGCCRPTSLLGVWGDLSPLTSDTDPPSHEHSPQSHHSQTPQGLHHHGLMLRGLKPKIQTRIQELSPLKCSWFWVQGSLLFPGQSPAVPCMKRVNLPLVNVPAFHDINSILWIPEKAGRSFR